MFYKDKFRSRLVAAQPETILDVGCGTGSLLYHCEQHGICAFGIDPDSEAIAACSRQGLSATLGHAEDINFPDNSVDLVVSEFSLHHYLDLSGFLREAVRVARRGILCLDAWYDLSIPSQKSASEFDRWMKRVDRASGEVHHDVYDIDRITSALPDHSTKPNIDAEYWLDLRPLAPSKLEKLKDMCLSKAGHKTEICDEFVEIDALIQKYGISEDGALFFQATWSDVMNSQCVQDVNV
ncbi:MAG: class I SAM-dependent methyltransferase [Pseudomonadota bacterium]